MKRLDEILKQTRSSDGAEPEETVGRRRRTMARRRTFVRCATAPASCARAVPVDHPDFGKAFPCECVLREREDERVRAASALQQPRSADAPDVRRT